MPLIEVRETGREISERDSGRSGRTNELLWLVRLLGLLSPFSRLGRGPKESRLMPEVESRATCF